MLENGKLFRALILALIGIGWMVDDVTSAAGRFDYKEVDWLEIEKSVSIFKRFRR